MIIKKHTVVVYLQCVSPPPPKIATAFKYIFRSNEPFCVVSRRRVTKRRPCPPRIIEIIFLIVPGLV